ncbi:AraC family transcriptional regulator [Sphaerochaeta sp. PS]|uniref:AraC family transcriptional regulator n=1 Tax=Sphaerochaeta sp. PS TaxID=3076336 RepID=UPI0028A56492|nr:AraC family transcriptional regulator [Sphaerochaeta sp. PS]MDT4762168.1 AraC family transcriptional regulator [Sphaerochaeta sp. PS]
MYLSWVPLEPTAAPAQPRTPRPGDGSGPLSLLREVTALCGYANSQTFRRAFRKYYGMLPSDYQKTVLYNQAT